MTPDEFPTLTAWKRRYPHTEQRQVGGDDYTLLFRSADDIWRVRDVVWQRRPGTWRLAEPFTDHRGRVRVFTRCDESGVLQHPPERRATPVGQGAGEFDHDLSTLTKQFARATVWTPEVTPNG